MHQALFKGMHALKAGDLGELQHVLSSATHACVLDLATSGSESVSAVNPGLVHLQLLQLLGRAAPHQAAEDLFNELPGELYQCEGGFWYVMCVVILRQSKGQ